MNGQKKTVLTHCATIVAVVCVGLLVQRYIPWHGDLWTRANRGLPQFGGSLAVAGAAVWLFFLLYYLWVLYRPGPGRKADDPSGAGCVQLVCWFIVSAFALLIMAIIFKFEWAIRLIAGGGLVLALIAVGGLIIERIETVLKKRG